MPTLEDAKDCPICNIPGKLAGTSPVAGGSKVLTFLCQNERCRWFDTGWIVQVKPDGTIPERKSGPKEFASLDVYQKAAAQAEIERTANLGKEIPKAP